MPLLGVHRESKGWRRNHEQNQPRRCQRLAAVSEGLPHMVVDLIYMRNMLRWCCSAMLPDLQGSNALLASQLSAQSLALDVRLRACQHSLLAAEGGGAVALVPTQRLPDAQTQAERCKAAQRSRLLILHCASLCQSLNPRFLQAACPAIPAGHCAPRLPPQLPALASQLPEPLGAGHQSRALPAPGCSSSSSWHTCRQSGSALVSLSGCLLRHDGVL